MPFNPDQIAALNAKLESGHVKKRSQAGRELSYIEGWHAIAEANRIFGFDGWNRETVELRQLGEPREVDGKWRVGYMAKVRIAVFPDKETAILREGCGYGSGIDRDVGSAHESALKEAETDAMKRALMTFGNPFGLALYDKEQCNVEKPEAAKKAPPPAPKNPDSYMIAVKSLPNGAGSDWPRWKAVMLKAIEQADSIAKLEKLMKDNEAGMAGLKQHAAPAWGDLNQVYTAKRDQLSTKKAA